MCTQITGLLKTGLDLLSRISSSELKLLCHSLILHQLNVTVKLVRRTTLYVLYTPKKHSGDLEVSGFLVRLHCFPVFLFLNVWMRRQ